MRSGRAAEGIQPSEHVALHGSRKCPHAQSQPGCPGVRDGRRLRAMGKAKRSVDRTPRDFLAAWGRGDAGPVPCGACTACCHYPGIVVDEKRDRKRLAHLLTERSPDGELVLQ